MQVINNKQALAQSLLEWEDLLNLNDEGEVTFPQQGELGFRYNPDSISLMVNRVKIDIFK